MFYKLIENKRNKWLNSKGCTIRELIDYITSKNQMRDAQIEAIKTYLFLKIACENRPLYELFREGYFNSISADDLELTIQAREILNKNKAAIALIEYSRIEDNKGNQLSKELENYIKDNPDKVDYNQVFFDLFYQVTYSDYLFSLPMGAGKTYLMAAFIYLDLYFAQNEPSNRAFAHNFIVFAPSGLKSSVVPSLKTIQQFNPEWIIPNPAAGELKRLINFEILDSLKSQKKSNKTKNPNVQKINQYQPFDSLMGLVAVTNAEKVILDRVNVDTNFMGVVLEQTDDARDKQANELRNLIGKIPNLAIYIDEVHHAVDDDIKLRRVVNKWTNGGNINAVIGFSGTPYLEKPEPVKVAERYTIKNIELSNVVYYYPLIDGINNFLKEPDVKISNNTNSLEIVENGVKDFMKNYSNKVYSNGTIAKLAIYCGNIENLEELVYPKVASVVQELGYNPNDIILKYHRGNKSFPILQEAETEFNSLDTPVSKKKIILLVQIGKEGWDCKSLTGVVLSQKGDCPTNMVLQTSCRCLRQVDKGTYETASIWLNKFNADTLNKQLKNQQNITLEDFSNRKSGMKLVDLSRYSRMGYLKLPTLDFYQLKVEHQTLVIDEKIDIQKRFEEINTKESQIINTIIVQDFKGEIKVKDVEKVVHDEPISFNQWVTLIVKESFGTISLSDLRKYEPILSEIFAQITTIKDNRTFLLKNYIQEQIRSRIRIVFSPKRNFETKEEIISQRASLLKTENFSSIVQTSNPEKYYPNQDLVKKIIGLDTGVLNPEDEKTIKAIEALRLAGQDDMADQLRKNTNDVPERNMTYHYLPYRFDSRFEKDFMEALKYKAIKDSDLEMYFNGDRGLTEFQIKCYKKHDKQWKYIGIYTPDFLIIKRKEGKIYQAVIVETKGKIYAEDKAFIDRKNFMESYFIEQNNAQFGYRRFEYLYLEDTTNEDKLLATVTETINHFFEN